MARNVLMSDLITRCRQRCDRVGDDHISDAEWQVLIASVYNDLYSLVAESGMRYYETEATITATGAASYALPADHLATIGIDFVLDSAGRRRPLGELMVQERYAWIGQTGAAVLYELAGQVIILHPLPSSGSYKHLYIPQSADLSVVVTSTNVDVVTPDGAEFLIWGVAVKALAKSEADVRLAMAEREAYRDRVFEWATLRALANPRRRVITDVDSVASDPSDWRYR